MPPEGTENIVKLSGAASVAEAQEWVLAQRWIILRALGPTVLLHGWRYVVPDDPLGWPVEIPLCCDFCGKTGLRRYYHLLNYQKGCDVPINVGSECFKKMQLVVLSSAELHERVKGVAGPPSVGGRVLPPSVTREEFLGNLSEGLLQPCPLCGFRVVCRNGYYGMYVGCSRYPSCRYSSIISKDGRATGAAAWAIDGRRA